MSSPPGWGTLPPHSSTLPRTGRILDCFLAPMSVTEQRACMQELLLVADIQLRATRTPGRSGGTIRMEHVVTYCLASAFVPVVTLFIELAHINVNDIRSFTEKQMDINAFVHRGLVSGVPMSLTAAGAYMAGP